MPTAEATLLIARSQVGTLESPAGSNCQKYSKELGRPCEYWCADGVSWVLKKAGVPDSPNTASTRAMRDFYKSRGRLDMTPKPGDVGLMHLTGRNGAGQPDHVGFVVSLQGSFVHTIEFNTSSGDAGSQDNGGGVFEKRRRLSAFIGFGHPAYDQEDDMTPQELRTALKAELEAIARIDADTDALKPAKDGGFVDSLLHQILDKLGGVTGATYVLSDADKSDIARRVADELAGRLKT